MFETQTPKEIHLVVFSHGLWGNTGHLKYFVEEFRKIHGEKVHILNAKRNESDYTYDGIDVCGDRLVEEIKEEVKIIQENNIYKITSFSIIGYSFGGLVARYAIGILYFQGFFKDIKPLYFTTFATPHLGIRRENDGNWFRFFNWTSSKLLSKTGEQLQFVDDYNNTGKPLLLIMSDPDKIYYMALLLFKYKRLYANTRNDRSVPYWTAAISIVNPFDNFEQLTIIRNKKFQSLIESASINNKQQKIPMDRKIVIFVKNMPKYLIFAVVVPILLPIWLIIGLSTITIQGIKSRRRVKKIFKRKVVGDSNSNYGNGNVNINVNNGYENDFDDEHSTFNHHTRLAISTSNMEEEVIETAMNIKNLLPQSHPSSTTLSLTDIESNDEVDSNSSIDDEGNDSMAKLSKSSLFPRVPLCEAQLISYRYLNRLKWEKYSVYIDAFNAHASIVVRNRFNVAGRDIIRHFVEEVFVS